MLQDVLTVHEIEWLERQQHVPNAVTQVDSFLHCQWTTATICSCAIPAMTCTACQACFLLHPLHLLSRGHLESILVGLRS